MAGGSGEARGALGYASALVVATGAIWIAVGLALGLFALVAHASVFTTGSWSSYPDAAQHSRIWADYCYRLFVIAAGGLTVGLGLRPFRRGETWAWWAVVGVAATGLTEALFDGIEWGGWRTAAFYALAPVLAVGLAAPTVFAARRAGRDTGRGRVRGPASRP